MDTIAIERDRRFNMIGTSCPNCGMSWDLHNEGECPEKPLYEPEQIAAIYHALGEGNQVIMKLEALMEAALTNRRMRRVDC